MRAGADPRRAPAGTRATPARQLDDLVLTRRSFLAAGVVALGLSASACGAAPVAHGHRVRLRLTLWAPTGPYAIGTVQLHLVEHSRRDPWVPARPREVMISIWFPAPSAGSYPSAPWMPKPAANLFLDQLVGSLPSRGVHLPGSKPPTIPLPGVQLPVTQAKQGAPVRAPGAPIRSCSTSRGRETSASSARVWCLLWPVAAMPWSRWTTPTRRRRSSSQTDGS